MTAAFISVLFAGILTQWVPGHWALAAFQLALFGLAAIMILRSGVRIAVRPAGALLVIAAIWGLLQIGAGRTVYAFRTSEAVLDWISYAVSFSLAYALLKSTAYRRFLTACEIFAVAVAIVAIAGILTSPARVFWIFEVPASGVPVGPFPYRNQYAAFVEAVLPIALAGCLWDRRRFLIHLIAAGTLVASVIAAGSRTGSVLVVCENLAVPLVAYLRGAITKATLLRAAAAALLAAFALTFAAGWETTYARLQESNPFALRLDLARSTLEMIRDRPLSGFGLGTWSTAYPGYARFDDGKFVNQAHNDWLQWAAEGGIPFVLLLGTILILTVRISRRSIWAIGLVCVFLHALVDYPFQQRPALAVFFFALMGAFDAESISSAGQRSTAGSYSAVVRSDS
jgi:O-antigen ligase